MTPEEYIAFLESQLAAAVAHLRAKDATEDACTERLNKIAKASAQQLQEGYAKKRERLKVIATELRASANRYALVRSHLVQIWKLGIAASGEQLDRVLDELIERSKNGHTNHLGSDRHESPERSL